MKTPNQFFDNRAYGPSSRAVNSTSMDNWTTYFFQLKVIIQVELETNILQNKK